jgi:hypothetical protein
MFEPLSEPAYFARVAVADETGTVGWPNGADLDPLVPHGNEPAVRTRARA